MRATLAVEPGVAAHRSRPAEAAGIGAVVAAVLTFAYIALVWALLTVQLAARDSARAGTGMEGFLRSLLGSWFTLIAALIVGAVVGAPALAAGAALGVLVDQVLARASANWGVRRSALAGAGIGALVWLAIAVAVLVFLRRTYADVTSIDSRRPIAGIFAALGFFWLAVPVGRVPVPLPLALHAAGGALIAIILRRNAQHTTAQPPTLPRGV